MNVHNLDVEHKREAWRDWFMIDPPVKSTKLIIWIDRAFKFYIDPSFDYYKVTGAIEKDDPPVFILTYLFEDEMYINKSYISTRRMLNDDRKYFQIELRKRGIDDVAK